MRFKKAKRTIVRVVDLIDRIIDFLVYFPLSNPVDQWREELKKENQK